MTHPPPSQSTATRVGFFLLPLLLVGNTGCLVFDHQTTVIAFPPDSREVRVLTICEGLHVQGDKDTDLTKAKEQLTSWATSGQEFYLGPSWIMHVSLKPDGGESPDAQAQKATLRKHLLIEKPTFFLNAAGKLCLYQAVTISDRDKFAAAMNDLIGCEVAREAAAALADPARRSEWIDEETLKLMEKAAGGPFAWFDLEPGRISLSMPISPAAAIRLKGLFPKEIPPKFPIDLPWSFDHRRNRITVSLGYGDGEPIRYDLDSEDQTTPQFEKELIDHARTVKAPFQKGVTREGLVEEFLKAQRKGKKP
jgi:hypothetical protein